MNPSFPDLLYNGVLLCISLQLMTLGVIKLGARGDRNTVLGLLCLFMGGGFVYNLYWTALNQSLLFNALLGGYKTLFYAPLAYLYVATIGEQGRKKYLLWQHLVVPLTFHLSYLCLKFGFTTYYRTYYFLIGVVMTGAAMLIYAFYFVRGFHLFRMIKLSLKPRIYIRYLLFYFALVGYGTLSQLASLLPIVLPLEMPQRTFVLWSRFLYSPLTLLIDGAILLFTLVESKYLRSIMFGDKIYSEFELIAENEDIKSFLQLHFVEQKSFTNPEFNVANSLRVAGIEEKRFRLYLKKEHNKNINTFINEYRIREFKNLVKNKAYAKYSLTGIAQQAGFKSRSTFYRQFKKQEGLTPKEYMGK